MAEKQVVSVAQAVGMEPEERTKVRVRGSKKDKKELQLIHDYQTSTTTSNVLDCGKYLLAAGLIIGVGSFGLNKVADLLWEDN